MTADVRRPVETVAVAYDSAPRRLGLKIMRSVVVGGLRYVLVAPIPFVVTPIILHRLGVSGYGSWAVFLAINGLTSLADLGLVGTLSKFVAEYYARQDFPGLERLLSSGLALFLLLDLVIGSSVWALAPLIAERLFRGSTIPISELIVLLRCFTVVIAANILSQLFASVTSGLQRLDLTHMMSAASTVMSAAFSVLLLFREGGMRGLVYGYMTSAIFTITIYYFVVRRLLPQVILNPVRFDRIEIRKMFGYSLRLYVTQAAVVVHNQVEKLFLAVMIGVAPVGWYDIASDTALKLRSGIGLILSPVLPAASELSALGDELRLRELYYRTHKYLAFLGVPIVSFVAAISNRFVDLWLGPNLRIIALPLSILLVVNFFNLATGPGFMIFAGGGNLRPGVRSAMLGVTLNVFLSLGLIYKFGFTGAVMGTSGALILASVYFIAVFHRQTSYSILRVLREGYLKPTICSVLLLALILTIRSTHGLSWFGLIEMGAIFGVLYFAAILQSGFFDEYDWQKIESLIPAASSARRLARIA